MASQTVLQPQEVGPLLTCPQSMHRLRADLPARAVATGKPLLSSSAQCFVFFRPASGVYVGSRVPGVVRS